MDYFIFFFSKLLGDPYKRHNIVLYETTPLLLTRGTQVVVLPSQNGQGKSRRE